MQLLVRRRAASNLGTLLVPTPSARHGAQGGAHAPPARAVGAEPRARPAWAEHGEHLPCAAPEHHGIYALAQGQPTSTLARPYVTLEDPVSRVPMSGLLCGCC
jgi:hypothetical protein